jgi:hypothetical protein
MTISRRRLISGATGGALAAWATVPGARTAQATDTGHACGRFEGQSQIADGAAGWPVSNLGGGYDLRAGLEPQRLTIAEWDEAYALRHGPGGSFADYDRVLDEAVERDYNTIRLDPMPQWIDLRHPDRVLEWSDPHEPFMPWAWNTAVKGPVGTWIIDFVERLLKRPSLHYTLSAWWFMPDMPNLSGVPQPLRRPANMVEGAEMWATQLTDWKQRFGFDRLMYVDIANESPYFFPNFESRLQKATGVGFEALPRFSSEQRSFLADEINRALGLLRREFPLLRFTTSIHDDLRWLDVPIEFDCLDVHFYVDADPRWTQRTRFNEFIQNRLYKTDSWFSEFSDRCMATARAMAPMLHARQRQKMGQFAGWAAAMGAPLTTSEGWSSWYYFDSPQLDWRWLLDWSSWACDAAIACDFWGWTPHNYTQTQFANWRDVKWHRELNARFLRS